jgi:hypothetical protein
VWYRVELVPSETSGKLAYVLREEAPPAPAPAPRATPRPFGPFTLPAPAPREDSALVGSWTCRVGEETLLLDLRREGTLSLRGAAMAPESSVACSGTWTGRGMRSGELVMQCESGRGGRTFTSRYVRTVTVDYTQSIRWDQVRCQKGR